MACLTIFLSLSVFLGIFQTEASDDVSLLSLETLVQQQASLIQQQAAKMQALESKVESLENLETQCSAEVGALKATQQKKAAFSVTFSGNQHPINIGDNAAIKYNRIVTNVGNGYASHSGIFTAPYAGIYAFFLSLRSDNDHGWIDLGLYKGNTRLLDITADGAGDPYDRGTGFVTTHLMAGDQVYARHSYGQTYLESGPYTTFSGVLVSAD